MNIKEIIDSYRGKWYDPEYKIEGMLDTIQKAADERIEELELELLRYKQAPKTPYIKGGTCNTTHYACDCVVRRIAELEATCESHAEAELALIANIKELEARVPKTAKPIIHSNSASGWRFECPECHRQIGIFRGLRYCHSCGCKLNWRVE